MQPYELSPTPTSTRSLAGPVLSALVALGLAVPLTGAAQQEAGEIAEEALTAFVVAHMGINRARDEFQAQLAAVHEEQARSRARGELRREIENVLAAQSLTSDEYDRILLLVSSDQGVRDRFEAILDRLSETVNDG